MAEIGRFGERVVVNDDRLRRTPGWPAPSFLDDYGHRAKPRNQRISSAAAAIRGEAGYGTARSKN